MPYWDNVGRSFGIAWRHKYLWLLGLFAAEGGGGSNFSYNQGTRSTGTTGSPSAVAQQVSQWSSQHAGLLVALAVLWIILAIALFILAAVCEGALIRSAAEHDADRPFRLREAWTMGVHTMWLIVRFRLLLLALGIPAVVIVVAVIVGGVLAAFANEGTLAVTLISLGAVLALALVVYLVYLSFLDRFGARAAILEQRGAVASLGRANQLLIARFGRSLLVWLVSIAVAIGVGIATAVVFVVAALPLIVATIAAFNGASAAWPFIVLGGLVLLAVALPIAGFLGAQASTYWTLSFRRMEIDYPPAYAYPVSPAPQPPAS